MGTKRPAWFVSRTELVKTPTEFNRTLTAVTVSVTVMSSAKKLVPSDANTPVFPLLSASWFRWMLWAPWSERTSS